MLFFTEKTHEKIYLQSYYNDGPKVSQWSLTKLYIVLVELVEKITTPA